MACLSSLLEPLPHEEKKAFWSRIIYLTGHYEVYCRNLFLIIKEKFWLSYLIFAASMLRHSTGAGLITGAHSWGSENGLGKHLVLEAEHSAQVCPFLGKHFNFAMYSSYDDFSESVSR